jgi:hypothetical protein
MWITYVTQHPPVHHPLETHYGLGNLLEAAGYQK